MDRENSRARSVTVARIALVEPAPGYLNKRDEKSRLAALGKLMTVEVRDAA